MTKEQKYLGEQMPYVHSFKRYFDSNGEAVDRLELILRHGLLSPKKAKQKGIPYSRLPMSFLSENFPDYDDLIFLYLGAERGELPIPGDTTLFFDDALKVINPQQRAQMVAARWPVFSIGEVYAIDVIEPSSIRVIRIPSSMNKDEVEKMVESLIPEPRNIKVTTL